MGRFINMHALLNCHLADFYSTAEDVNMQHLHDNSHPLLTLVKKKYTGLMAQIRDMIGLNPCSVFGCLNNLLLKKLAIF